METKKKKKDSLNVEQWKSLLRNQQTLAETFSLNYDTESVKEVLELAVRRVVFDRRKEYADKYARVIDAVATWLTDPTYSGLYMCGVVGCGKTTLMKAVGIVINNIGDVTDGKYFFRSMTAKEAMKLSCDGSQDNMILAIDDLGTEPVEVVEYGNVTTPLKDLLYYRYEHRLRTIITTNMKPEEIKERYGKRISDRMKEEYVKVAFENGSFRTAELYDT